MERKSSIPVTSATINALTSEYAAANLEVLETITTSARKRKRGEYNHYSPDQRYKIAKYAVENGVSKAAKHFSKHLGKNINESSIRTIKKAYL